MKKLPRNLKSDLPGSRVRVSNIIEPNMAETEFSLLQIEGDSARAGAVYRDTQPLEAKNIADINLWVVIAPMHVSINSVEFIPVAQAWGPFAVNRDK